MFRLKILCSAWPFVNSSSRIFRKDRPKLSNVGGHVPAERGVVPNDVSMAVPSSRVRGLCRRNRERKFVVVPAVSESFLIKRRRFAKAICIYRDFGQPFVNGLWDVFDDAGWMVRFLVGNFI